MQHRADLRAEGAGRDGAHGRHGFAEEMESQDAAGQQVQITADGQASGFGQQVEFSGHRDIPARGAASAQHAPLFALGCDRAGDRHRSAAGRAPGRHFEGAVGDVPRTGEFGGLVQDENALAGLAQGAVAAEHAPILELAVEGRDSVARAARGDDRAGAGDEDVVVKIDDLARFVAKGAAGEGDDGQLREVGPEFVDAAVTGQHEFAAGEFGCAFDHDFRRGDRHAVEDGIAGRIDLQQTAAHDGASGVVLERTVNARLPRAVETLRPGAVGVDDDIARAAQTAVEADVAAAGDIDGEGSAEIGKRPHPAEAADHRTVGAEVEGGEARGGDERAGRKTLRRTEDHGAEGDGRGSGVGVGSGKDDGAGAEAGQPVGAGQGGGDGRGVIR